MMKKLFAITAISSGLLASAATAQVDYSVRTASSFKTLAQLSTDSGQTLTATDGVLVDGSGNVYVMARTGGFANFLIAYNSSGTFLGVSGDLDTADDGDFRANGAFVLGSIIYSGDFANETGDAIKAIDITNPAAITFAELIDDAGIDGLDGLTESPGGNIAVFRGSNNGGNSSLAEVTTAGTITPNTVSFTTALGGDIGGLFTSTGDVIVYDRSTPAIELITDPFGTPVSSNGASIFGGSYVPVTPSNLIKGADADDLILVDRGTPASIIINDGSTVTTIPFTEVSAGFSPRDRYGIGGHAPTATSYNLYGADFSSGDVFKIEFTASASVDTWNLYN